MALVEYGGGVTAFRGSIGGVTFHSNRAGKIARLKPYSRKVVTEAQIGRIAVLGDLVVIWDGLTAAQKTGWMGFADTYTKTDKWGDTRTLSGFNWFFSINSNRRLIGESDLLSYPVYANASVPPVFTVVCNSTRILLKWDAEYSYSDTEMVVYTTPPLNRVTNSFRGHLRFTKVVSGSDVKSQYIETEWKSVHGLNYPPSGVTDQFSIGVACLFIRNSSGVSNAMRIANGIFEAGACGVGCMIIGSTFIVG